ncbi:MULTISPECIES: 2'-5' RNA ligase family protein [unclassified Nonomuraea]|uniref:2'-5' RNA ligase family protein n=1 Tax=unclassified Nonomuraea TaxID=2593643 RepID=UPI0035BF0E3F
MEFKAGDTALIVKVPEAEPLVRRWRKREIGIMAHVTVLVPFLHVSRVDEGVRRELGALFARQPAVDVSFHRIGRFPDVVYLAPDPAGPFVRLTEDVVARWPEAPPYGGLHDAIVPHLTLGHGVAVDEAAAAAALPLAARVTGVSMLVRGDDEFWQETEFFPFA